jgi:hypothetical protein
MIERLGNARHWASCVISGLALLAAAAGAVFGHGPDRFFAIAIFTQKSPAESVQRV